MATIFDVQRPAIVKHINNIYKSKELRVDSTCSILEQVASDGKNRKMNLYNLDMILSVGYRVNSSKATLFRQWATQRLKVLLVQGYAINEQRLAQKQQQIQTLNDGIKILSRVIEEKAADQKQEWLHHFAKGLELLDDYDHENLDKKGLTKRTANYPSLSDYQRVIASMRSDFESGVFSKEKDGSFESAINQIS